MNLNPEDDTLSNYVCELGYQLYGQKPRVHKFHSQVSYVCALEFNDLPTKIIKLERNEPGAVVTEIERLRALASLNLPIATIEITHNDVPNAAVPFYVTSRLATLRLGDLVWSKNSLASTACARAGQFIRELHQHNASELPTISLGSVESPDFQHLLPRLTNQAAQQVQQVIQAVQNLEATTPHALCHGQLHPENVLADANGGFGVVDWDTLRVGSIWADVALFLRTVREWCSASEEHLQAFWNGLGISSNVHRYEVELWSTFESASSLDWQLGASIAVSPESISHLEEQLVAFA